MAPGSQLLMFLKNKRRKGKVEILVPVMHHDRKIEEKTFDADKPEVVTM